jgi:hypothetical protein
MASCATKPTFKPEVDGAGAISGHGGVVYSIPSKNPVLKMKLASMWIPKQKMVHLRIYFLRKGAAANEYLDPREQSIVLPDSATPIAPSRVHASTAAKPIIKLADVQRQTVELLFPVPQGGAHEYPYIKLNWKIHYVQDGKNQVMSETVRFDYISKSEPQKGVGQYDGDVEFPYANYFSPPPEDWITPGWMWW